ncbi:hypothetical protein COLO4_08232 [Corchorus olitorius]|uniref:Uncharacterized protein n=1 Tax=Corchorus olitorius TaxID=93759 RepID=A0A1R3KGR2_9ROSI|nr:hypothetical protein COLO4_08232 [Corchorus olitorius]
MEEMSNNGLGVAKVQEKERGPINLERIDLPRYLELQNGI